MKYKVFVTLLLFTAMLVLPVSASSPEITEWYNDKTDNDNLDITININETIKFNVTANQSIYTWNWSIDGGVETNNYDNFTTSWATDGVKNVSVNATNSNGSDVITWKVTVQEEEPETEISAPEIISWCNNETNNDDLEIILIINEIIKFNVTANQSIESWNWSINNVVQDNNFDNFTTSWATEGVRNVSVNATNSNGSDIITWKVTVKNVTENGIILSWTPKEIVDYINVNDTISETITYSITTSVQIDDPKWTVDGTLV
ncbi:MAG: hypothetical protein MIO93_02775, partial [ANME-2 cluster archaeon]|nr:hypothetical protein [ANME-2 cluster archaeon]